MVEAPSNLDNAEWKKAWAVQPNDVKFATPEPGQLASLTFRAQIIVYKQAPSAPIKVWCSLQNTHVSPGKIAHDEDEWRGSFHDTVDVHMWLQRSHFAGPKDHKLPKLHPLPNFKLTSYAPDTPNNSGSVTSSVTSGVSANAGVGMFDNLPTANAGVGISSSNTHSFSETYQDFEVIDNSDGKIIHHSYNMMQAGGVPYNGPKDLVPDESFLDRYKAIKLNTLPLLAKSNLPLVTQAVWTADTADLEKEDARLYIAIRPQNVSVKAQNLPNPINPFIPLGPYGHYYAIPCVLMNYVTLPFKQMASDIGNEL